MRHSISTRVDRWRNGASVALFALLGASAQALAAPACNQAALNASAAASDGGYGYIIRGTFGTAADNSAKPTASSLRVFEGGVELAPAHSLHADVRNLGQGRFSHWSSTDGSGEALRFSASNNSDPRTNGRSYTYCTTSADITRPTVSITAPTSGTTVTGNTVSVSANAADDVAIVGVQFKLDGVNLGAEDTSAPYTVAWNSATAANGSHVLTAIARDAAGNMATSASLTVTVNNAAACTQKALGISGAASDGGFAYIVRASFGTPADNSSNPTVSLLRIFESGVELTPPHTAHDDIRNIGRGRFSHWSATDGSGEALRFSASNNGDPRTNGKTYTYCAGSAPVGSDTIAPTVAVTAPANGATVSGTTVTLSANASDNVGVASVSFSIDGATLFTDSTAPYSAVWNSTMVGNGAHTVTAVARDAAGNATTSAIVTLTVSNGTPAAATKTLLYGWINDWWLSDTIASWANSGYKGFIIPGYLQWFSSPSDLAADQPYATNLNQRGKPYGITDNFYSISLSNQNWADGSYLPAWQDDAGWNSVLTNFANIGNFARTTGMKGLVFDTENYTAYKLWQVADPRHGGLSKASLKPYVYKRGQQLMQTLQAAYPGIQIMLIQEGSYWAYHGDPYYELWPDFYNGMASVQAQPGIIVGSESTYPEDGDMSSLNGNPDAFIRNRGADLQNSMLAVAENPAYWKQYGSLAIGMRPLGVDYSNKSARYTPDVFKAQLNAAKAVSGPYVWVYSHGSAWWQMTQAEVNTYSNNPWHYTADKADQVLPTNINIQSYFNVVNGTY